MRVFIAATLPDEVKQHLDIFNKQLQQDYQRFKITWSDISKYHITLEFLGELSNDEVQLAEELLEQVVDKFIKKQFKLEFFEYSAFPTVRKPKILIIKARNKLSHNLADLQRVLHNELLNKGFKLDSKVWRPHVTLGRVRDQGVKINFEKHPFDPIELIVKDFSVYSSDLQPTGAVYKQLVTYHV